MTEKPTDGREDELATAYRDAAESAETLAEEWADASSEAWDDSVDE